MSIPILFDSPARRKHRLRQGARMAQHDFMWQEAGQLVIESLEVMTHPFPNVVEIDPRCAMLSAYIRARQGTQQVQNLTVWDEQFPLDAGSVDAVIANLSLYAVNDLPGMLVQIRRALRPDGLFIATLPGAQSLHELRDALAQAESELTGGMSPRVAPFIDVREAGNLMGRAGFALPVTDSLSLPVSYSSMFTLMEELRGAGEANMLSGRQKSFTRRQLFLRAAEHYVAQHSTDDGRITATAEIVTLTGWAPASTQQQPARRGSGTVHLTDVFKH